MAHGVKLPRAYTQPAEGTFQICLFDDEAGPTPIGEALQPFFPYRRFGSEYVPASLAQMEREWRIEKRIDRLLGSYVTALAWQQNASDFKADAKKFKSAIENVLKIYGQGNSAVVAQIIQKIDSSKDKQKFGPIGKNVFHDLDGGLLISSCFDGLNAIDGALSEVIAAGKGAGRHRDQAAYKLIHGLADLYENVSGKAPGRSGGNSLSRTPFERLVDAVLDQFDRIVTAANEKTPAKLPLSVVSRDGVIQRVLAERNSPKKG